MGRHTWFARTTGRFALVAAGVFALAPATAGAQQGGSVSFQAQGGVAVPVSDLADVTDPGATFGAGVAYWIGPRVAIRADGDVSLLTGKDSEGTGPEGPDVNLFHYNGGLQLRLTDPELSRFHFLVNLGAGATTFDADEPEGGGQAADFTETYFAANGGLGVGLDLTSAVSLFLDGQWYLVFTDEEETAVFGDFTEDGEGFDTGSVVPVTLGLRIRTN